MKQAWDIALWRISARNWIKLARMARERGDTAQYRKCVAGLKDARNEARL